MRAGLWSELRRLWIKLVMKTVLPERLRPVTASQTVRLSSNSVRSSAFASQLAASATAGGSQLALGIRYPAHACRWAESGSRQAPPQVGQAALWLANGS